MDAMRVKGVYCPQCQGYQGEISNISDYLKIEIYCYKCEETFTYKLED